MEDQKVAEAQVEQKKVSLLGKSNNVLHRLIKMSPQMLNLHVQPDISV